MNRADYIKETEEFKIDPKKVDIIEKIYQMTLPDIIKKIISNAEESIFFDDDYRILSFDEIKDAADDLHVDFKAKGIIPIADCGENDFIVFHAANNTWSMFNIIDEAIFKTRNSLKDFLK